MSLILDGLVDPDAWIKLWDGDISAVPLGDLPLSDPKCSYLRIPSPQTCPVLVEYGVLAFQARSAYALQHWTTAGYINQLVATGIESSYTEKYQAYRKRVTLGNPQLLFLPILTQSVVAASKIELMVPRWLKHIEWSMWGYSGQISTAELIELARVRSTQFTIIQGIDQINYKLDLMDNNTSSKST